MASFADHTRKAKENLEFLGKVNENLPGQWDWNITIGFYAAVHLINSHLAKAGNLHYRSHAQVDQVINAFGKHKHKIDPDTYVAYKKLSMLSRRARYLVSDNEKNKSTKGHSTGSKHLAKAIRLLNIILAWHHRVYKTSFEPVFVDCPQLKDFKSQYFST